MATIVTRQDSQFYTHTLDNGLQMLGQQILGVQSAAVVFWVDTGTRDEPAEQMGISHFLEHMAFRRTPNFVGQEVDRVFEEIGAEHNAGTWLEMTFYWAKLLSDNVDQAINVLSELVRPVLDADDFDQERNVILEEIARYEDMPTHVLFDFFMRDFFGDHPLSRETLGTPETIKAMTIEQMRAYWLERYGARNTLFAIAGNFEWDRVVQQVQGLTGGWYGGTPGRATRPAPFRPGVFVRKDDRFVQQQIAMGMPTVASNDPRYYASALLAIILGDDTGSRLFWSVFQKGLAESATSQVMPFQDNGMLLVHVGSEPALTGDALRAVDHELQRLQAFDVEQDELDRAQAKLISSVIIGGESTNERVMSLIRSWLTHGRLESLEETRAKIEAVTLSDLKELLAEYPVWPARVLTALGPLEEKDLLGALAS